VRKRQHNKNHMKKLIVPLFVSLLAITGLSVSAQTGDGQGDAGQFILQQAIIYGGSPTTTNGLPTITSHWNYKKYEHGLNGVMIKLPRTDYTNLDLFLSRAYRGRQVIRQKDSVVFAAAPKVIISLELFETGTSVQIQNLNKKK